MAKISENEFFIKPTIYGVGINDSSYAVTRHELVRGKKKVVWKCPYYSTWVSMLTRCYSKSYHSRRPTYIGCVVCEKWHRFSEFRLWMLSQDWKGKELDKDILREGNKTYSPENCAFVSAMTNSFFLDSLATVGDLPLGVCRSSGGKFRAQCNNPFSGKREYLGRFMCPNEAHIAWMSRKKELAIELAKIQSDHRVSAAIIKRLSSVKHLGQ